MFWRSHRAISEKEKSKIKGEPLLVLGIHSSGIKATLLALDNVEVNILSVVETKFESAEFVTDKLIDVAGIFDCVQKTLREIENDSRIKVKRFVASLSGTIVKSGTQVLRVRRDDAEKKLDLAEFTQIVQKLETDAIQQARKQFTRNQGTQEKDLKLLHASLLEVKLDGKKVASPLGLPARHVECSFYNSFVNIRHRGIMQTLASELDLELLGVVPDIVGISSLLPLLKNPIQNGFIIDVGAATTTVAFIKDNALVDSLAFNLGGNSFSKRLMYALHVNQLDAEKIKKAYSENLLETQSRNTIYEALKLDVQLWLDAVNHSIKQLINNSFLRPEQVPTTVVLSGGGAQLPELTQALLSVDWQQDIDFLERARIEHLDLAKVNLPFLNDDEGKLETRFISLVGVGVLSRKLIAQEEFNQSILQKALRLISV